MVSSIPVTLRCTLLALASLALSLVAGPAAGQAPPSAAPAQETAAARLDVPALRTEGGPLFALAPLVDQLGGRLEARRGDSWILFLLDREILFGPDADTLGIGTEILPLSQPPRVIEERIYVPLDFLQLTYGNLAGKRFAWDAERGRLLTEQRRPRTLPVTTDVVHLQGVTTVVLQFSQEPEFHVVDRPGGVDVLLLGDRLANPGRRPVDDPLVAGVEIGRQRIRLDLEPGAEADSYTLRDPFRIVFDVVERETSDTAQRQPPPVRPEPPEGVRTIVLDPGHGGGESGAVGPSGVQEKELTLLLARALKARLESALGVRVLLTRDDDAELPLETRTSIANQNKADLFVSLHLNSAFGSSARGAETYFLSATASDERAARAAEMENRPAAGGEAGAAADGDPLYDLQLILWDLAQSHFLAESQELANLIQRELNGTLELRDRGVKQAPFVVLMGAAMPAVLVEMGFLSNPEEERKLQDPAYRAQLTAALTRAIGAYKRRLEGTDGGGTGAGAQR